MPVWKHQPQLNSLAPSLHDWFQSELGRAVFDVEQRLVDRCLRDCFGYHLLQLGIDNSLTLYGDCRVQRCYKAGPIIPAPAIPATSIQANDPRAFVQCDFHELPFESDSVDAVIVHHVLEFAANPHAVLRELYRVTIPHGRVVLIGFNPWSAFGARMALSRWRSDSMWRNHLLSAARVNDWLSVLGFEAERIDYGFHRLPFDRTAPWPRTAGVDNGWSRHWPLGGVYAITAVKQVAKFIPIKPRWARLQPVLTPLPVAKPSASLGSRREREQ